MVLNVVAKSSLAESISIGTDSDVTDEVSNIDRVKCA